MESPSKTMGRIISKCFITNYSWTRSKMANFHLIQGENGSIQIQWLWLIFMQQKHSKWAVLDDDSDNEQPSGTWLDKSLFRLSYYWEVRSSEVAVAGGALKSRLAQTALDSLSLPGLVILHYLSTQVNHLQHQMSSQSFKAWVAVVYIWTTTTIWHEFCYRNHHEQDVQREGLSGWANWDWGGLSILH